MTSWIYSQFAHAGYNEAAGGQGLGTTDDDVTREDVVLATREVLETMLEVEGPMLLDEHVGGL